MMVFVHKLICPLTSFICFENWYFLNFLISFLLFPLMLLIEGWP